MPLITSQPITSETQWLELRRHNVGASEIAALFGVHEYLTGFGLAARKLGRLPETLDNPVKKRGRLLEPVAKQLIAEDRPDWEQFSPNAYFCDTEIAFGATPDLFVKTADGKTGVVQIKTVAPQVFAQKWHGENGEIVPPLWIALQAMAEQHLTGTDFAYVAALIVGYGLSVELVEVPTLPSVVEQMRQKVCEFWQVVNSGELPAPDYGVDGEILAQILSDDDGTEIDLTESNELPAIVAQLEAAKQAKTMAEKTADHCRAKILHAIGTAQRVKFAGGMLTAKTLTRREYLVPAGTYRPLRVKYDDRDNAEARA